MRLKIDKVILEDFIVWCTEGGFSGTVEDLEDLMLQFSSAINSIEFKKYVDSLVRMNLSISKFNMVECLVKILEVRHIKEYSDQLKALGFPGEYDPKKKERYSKELRSAYNNAKSFLIEAKLKKKELEDMQKNSIKKATTRQNFDESIVTLSKFLGYQIKENEISVQKYCLMIKRQNEYEENSRRGSR